jgi:hypothetical protein
MLRLKLGPPLPLPRHGPICENCVASYLWSANEATLEETPYSRYVTSDGWFVLNLADALAVCNEEMGDAAYPIEPRKAGPFDDFGIHVRVLGPREPNALYHSEGVQEGFLVFSGECTLIVEEEERPLRPVGLLPLPGRHPPRDRRRRRGAIRDSHDGLAARSRDTAVPGERVARSTARPLRTRPTNRTRRTPTGRASTCRCAFRGRSIPETKP